MKNSSSANRLLRRGPASQYLLERHGITRAATTLAGDACRGVGPEIEYVNKVPFYRPAALDAYAAAVLSPPTRQARRYERPRNPGKAEVHKATRTTPAVEISTE
jgi:hypothetical protein